VKVRAWGPKLADAFIQACRGFTAVLTNPEELRTGHSRPILLVAPSRDALLYDLLSEVIYFHDIDGFLPVGGTLTVEQVPAATGAQSASWRLRGALTGDIRRGEAQHGDVKAMTYFELVILEEPQRAVVEFVLDL
jgi:SHS2 domain-containing protein